MTINPWEEDTQMSMRELVTRSMQSAEYLVADREMREKASTHFNTMLEQRESKGGDQDDKDALKLMNRLFATAGKAMESDADKQRLVVLKDYVSCLISTSLGVDAFRPNWIPEDESNEDEEEDEEDNKPMSWADVASRKADDESNAEKRNAWCRSYEAGRAAERREHVRAQQLARQYYHQQDEDPEDWGPFEPKFLEELPSEVFCMPMFFPSEDSYHSFISAIKSAEESLHICIFSLTDNTTARAIANAQRRGVDVRIISDNDQLEAKGSDVERLHDDEGIPVKYDTSEQFMHNKFAVIDNRMVITGSFNWSIAARYRNNENIVITNIPSVVEAYQNQFERIWEMY
ncbi:phosphatidylserine phosphatidylglycerophosphatecardiolipin synthase-like protein [Lichtheimia corymbifera JMRC:FSU:9682]|uniref:Mitochondrial cardiolipin hydrolase n=1 Tax=Lichtheimia corymbifera JMRC:FSU:9682 TaxID=1263082 RepID=A0A068RIS5_9FUNG|nr:phosphatidylserine phosphatidylglycerophosphatecardiolipin synthase-like protein [Lichtheimia corymbifera JMRC:FSU:9682]